MLSAAERRAKINAIFRVASCNFLEAYDFFIYAYYARYIAVTFFPNENPYLQTAQTLAVFGAGFVMRPLGAILLGAYMDKYGRRKGLILTLGLMAVGTLAIAVTPGYATIGWLGPFIVIVGRLLQGLSAGAEFGGVAVYLSEISTPGRRGFYCSWQPVSQQVAVIAAALIGVVLTAIIPPAEMTLWGWRVPLLIGVVAIPFLYWLRRSLPETQAFVHSRHVRSLGEVLRILGANWALILNGMAHHDHVLSDHRLHADLRAAGPADDAPGQPPRDHARRVLEPSLAACGRLSDRPLRCAPDHAGGHRRGIPHGVSGHVVPRRCPRFRKAARGLAVVFVLLRAVQRLSDPDTCEHHASGSPRHRLFARFRHRDRPLWRFHALRRELSRRSDGKPGRPSPMVDPGRGH
jgi:hypothetical protein